MKIKFCSNQGSCIPLARFFLVMIMDNVTCLYLKIVFTNSIDFEVMKVLTVLKSADYNGNYFIIYIKDCTVPFLCPSFMSGYGAGPGETTEEGAGLHVQHGILRLLLSDRG